MPNSTPKKQSFFGGAAVLAVGIMAVKVISMLYKLPIVNILDEGYQDFTNAYNVYNVLLVISTAGLPVAMSKMVSEASTLGRQNQVHKIFRVAMLFFLILGLISFLIMFLGAQGLANLMNDSKAAPSIRVLAPAVIGVGCLSAFRGYAQGHSNMTPTSVSQIIEALIKLFVGLGLSLWMVSVGFSNDLAAAGAIAGVTIGTLLSLVYMVADFLRTRRSEPRRGTDRPESSASLSRRLLAIAIPITLTSSFMSVITLIDNSLVQGRLQSAVGLSEDACRALMTNYTGVQNVYQLPPSLMVAITASVIPAVSACFARRDRKGAARIVGSSLKVTALLAFPSGVGMIVLGEPLAFMFFGGSRSMTTSVSGEILSILGVACIFVCLMMVANSILQSHDILHLPILTMLLGGVVMILFDYFVVAIPSVNIIGSPVGTCFCYGITAVLDLAIVKRVVRSCPSFLSVFGKPLAASVVMGAAAWACYGLVSALLRKLGILCVTADGVVSLSRLGCTVDTLFTVLVACAVYIALTMAMGTLTRDDLALMPKGEKLAKLLHIR